MEQTKEPVAKRIDVLIRRYPSRSAAARAWGINTNTLKSYFRKTGDTPEPRENVLLRIAEHEKVDLDWLKTGRGKSPSIPKSTAKGEGDQLTEMLSFLTSEEREALTSMFARKGVETVLRLLDKDTQELLQLEGRKRLAALMLVDMPDEQVREILEEIEASILSHSVKAKAG
ncbi:MULTISPECIES: hypothetical protein [Enterobacteriaceae]|uniref:hypothetical protein n=1 Tax=Enterobacteriaceae TaxID=543 RepID=UPI000510FD30|nr:MULTISPECIES: hypothetical protein [Enterobacteriaceae]EFP8730385.1 hypothetical protein [Shigella sonnei]EFX4015374.1 hypothetical protein [Shigella flexneri]EFK6621161.1 hypothetical protein [Escherichia coli]EFP8835921.1 hypothetical protein [Shigella sonnei]EFP8861070.1 hypothetical protein [Shigella sonnei]